MFNKKLIKYQIIFNNPLARSDLHRAFLPCKLKRKVHLKYETATKEHSLKNSSSHNKYITYLSNTHEGAHAHSNGRHSTCSSAGYWTIHGNSPSIYKITILKRILEWLLPNIPFTIRVKNLFTKLGHIYMQKHCYKF